MFRNIVLCLCAFFIFEGLVLAQEPDARTIPDAGPPTPATSDTTPQPELTKDEIRQARAVADEFTQRMLDGEDPDGIANDLFVADFIERFQNARQKQLLGDESRVEETNMFFMSDDLWNTADPRALREDYFSMASLMSSYVSVIAREYHKSSDDGDDPEPWEKYIVPSLTVIAEKNPFAGKLLADDNDNVKVESTADMEQVTRLWTQLAQQLRQDHPGADFAAVAHTDAARDFAKDPENEPELKTFDRDAYGCPAGTRFITVNTLAGMWLIMAPENGHLKIVWAEVYSD